MFGLNFKHCRGFVGAGEVDCSFDASIVTLADVLEKSVFWLFASLRIQMNGLEGQKVEQILRRFQDVQKASGTFTHSS